MEAQERADSDMDDNEITPADVTASLYQFAAMVLTLRTEGEKLNARQSTQLDEALCLLAIDMRKAAEILQLRGAKASFHMVAYRLRCDEKTKAQAVEIERLRGAIEAARPAGAND